ncbi:hypothetical protein TNCV_4350071 [Trichonephila clavipes]|nr:hypothetical protein TNCV_4350071 [Trichonephila clavipes]
MPGRMYCRITLETSITLYRGVYKNVSPPDAVPPTTDLNIQAVIVNDKMEPKDLTASISEKRSQLYKARSHRVDKNPIKKLSDKASCGKGNKSPRDDEKLYERAKRMNKCLLIIRKVGEMLVIFYNHTFSPFYTGWADKSGLDLKLDVNLTHTVNDQRRLDLFGIRHS